MVAFFNMTLVAIRKLMLHYVLEKMEDREILTRVSYIAKTILF
jgi:hypothetical protein